MNVTTLTVEQPGLTTAQDLGRPGYGRLGVAANGAADRYAAAVASALVANDAHDPLLEVTATGFVFSVDRPSLVAVTGAAEEVEVDGAAQPVWQTLAVPAGARIAVAEPRRGLRSYVAVGGRLRADRTLGSVAPDPLLEVGPRLDAGATLEVATRYAGLDHPHTVIPVFRFRVDRPALTHDWTIDVTPGPDTSQFGDGVLADGAFEVAPESDYVGLRLTGSTPSRQGISEILSRGVPVGAIEIPPAGGLLALLRGRLLTAGYPVVGVATTVAVDRLAQARPGDVLRFRACSPADGIRAAREQAAILEHLARGVREALASLGLGRVH